MIPAFDKSGFLPPFLDNALSTERRSPYPTTIFEMADRFGSTRPRRALLRGLLNYRRHLREFGMRDGLQWIDGSFVEDSESKRGRPPFDIDIVTFTPFTTVRSTTMQAIEAIRSNTQLFSRQSVLATYGCDAYIVDTAVSPDRIIRAASYWTNVFGHERVTGKWKGILQLEMNDGFDLKEYQEAIDGLAH
ncbi:hypothetical protein KPL74_20050 [Bacillus sp. NP157]|nr:hypothetical protein KPL74_20050 [Bacillus sp. NP157]